MPIELYEHPASPYCRSIKLVASILKVPLETIFVNLLEKEQHKPEFLEKNPFHLVPTINDNGFYLSESRAIAGYLVDKYAPDNALYPKDIQKRAQIDQMLYFDGGTLAPAMSGLVRPIVYLNIIPGPEAHDKAMDILKTLDQVLGMKKYVAGDTLSIADIAIRATLSINEVLGSLDLSDLKNITAWAQTVKNETNPAYSEINDPAIEQFSEILKVKIAQIKAKSK